MLCIDQALIIEANRTVIVFDLHAVEAQIAVTVGDLPGCYGDFQRLLGDRQQLIRLVQHLVALCQFKVSVHIHGVEADCVIDDTHSLLRTAQFNEIVAVEQHHTGQIEPRAHQLLGGLVEIQIQLMFQRIAQAQIHLVLRLPVVHANLGVDCLGQAEGLLHLLLLQQLLRFVEHHVDALAVDIHHLIQQGTLVLRQNLIRQISNGTLDLLAVLGAAVLVRLRFQIYHIDIVFPSQTLPDLFHNFFYRHKLKAPFSLRHHAALVYCFYYTRDSPKLQAFLRKIRRNRKQAAFQLPVLGNIVIFR